MRWLIPLLLLSGCAQAPINHAPVANRDWDAKHNVYVPTPDDPGTSWLREAVNRE